MEPRLTRGEYWLLETVVECYVPLSFLCSERYSKNHTIEHQFNKRGHGLDRDCLIATIAGLVRDGLIEGFRDDGPYSLNESTIIAALDEPPPLKNPSYICYGMTELGANVWEAFAAPEWDQFILDGGSPWPGNPDLEPGSATCMTRWRLERYLEMAFLAGHEIDAQSVVIEPCGPWSATYWKTLPEGYQAQFQWRYLEDPSRYDPARQLAFAGFCEFRDGWYRWR